MTTNPFTPEHEMLRHSFRSFVEKEIIPNVKYWEENKICEREVFSKMGKEGFFGVSFPEEYGGSGMDMWSAVVISEELTKANIGGLSMSLYAHTYLPGYQCYRYRRTKTEVSCTCTERRESSCAWNYRAGSGKRCWRNQNHGRR
jgi:alkylation response protein AidB-like acyl-CoA dehydrogenase